jgi:hypothetical protein
MHAKECTSASPITQLPLVYCTCSSQIALAHLAPRILERHTTRNVLVLVQSAFHLLCQQYVQ